MKKYTGTKTVEATPAYRGDDGIIYPKHTPLPAELDPLALKDGYMVMYEDGYISWSPKDVFEKAYHLSETFYDRLIIEHKDLAIKLEGLKKMIESDRFKSIDIIHQMDLQNQYKAMSDYEFILYSRIQALSPTRDLSGGTNM